MPPVAAPTTGRAPDITELLGSVAAGDSAAFAALYDAVSARLHGIVLRVLLDRAMSEEVTQEVFLTVWRTASRFDPARGSAMGWLLTIAHRAAVDRVRSSQASRVRDTTYVESRHEVDFDSTAEQAHASLEAQRVRAALGTLTPGHRTALELAYFEGLTHTEVAARLGIPLGTAKTRIRDGLRRLRDSLSAEYAVG